MPNEHSINELMELFSSRDRINNDFAEAFGLMREHLHNKYTGKMAEAVTSYKSNINENPTAEVMLLKAFKPFIHERGHEKIDSMINTLQMLELLKDMRGTVSVSSADNTVPEQSAQEPEKPFNASIHADGVYDIDEECYIKSYGNSSGNMAGIMMLLALMNGR